MNRKLIVSALIAVLAGVAPSAAGAVSITNGSFEAVQIGAQNTINPADIPGWTHSGDVGDALMWNNNFNICCNGNGGIPNAFTGDGHQFVSMGGGFNVVGSTSAWSQVLTGLVVGQTYVINFKVAAEGETPTQQLTVGMTTGSLTPSQLITTPVSPGIFPFFWANWGSESYSFVADATSATLQFSVSDQAYDVGLDAVSISSGVPEPSTWAMLMIGFAGLGFVSYRQSRRRARLA